MIKIYLRQVDYADKTDLYLVDERDGKKYFAEPMDLIFKTVNDSEIVKPTLELSGYVAREFLPALSQALSESGYRPKTDEGKQIEALKYHLEDLRTLVFKKESK